MLSWCLMSTHYSLVAPNVWSDWWISKQLCRHLIAWRSYSPVVSQRITPHKQKLSLFVTQKGCVSPFEGLSKAPTFLLVVIFQRFGVLLFFFSCSRLPLLLKEGGREVGWAVCLLCSLFPLVTQRSRTFWFRKSISTHPVLTTSSASLVGRCRAWRTTSKLRNVRK